jgi:glycerol-3-phosphate dehydrogenase
MIRDISRLTARRFDVLVIGGGIQGLAIAYDAAQRGLATALIERSDFGSGSSFNHAKTVHGGLRSLQTGDVPKARFSIRERRAMARIAPNFVTPLRFMMATTTALMRSRAALSIGFGVDAVVGHDRNEDVMPWLHLPAGRVVSRAEYEAAFGPHASCAATGGATWCDYHMPESDRLTLAFAGSHQPRGRHRELCRGCGTAPPGCDDHRRDRLRSCVR